MKKEALKWIKFMFGRLRKEKFQSIGTERLKMCETSGNPASLGTTVSLWRPKEATCTTRCIASMNFVASKTSAHSNWILILHMWSILWSSNSWKIMAIWKNSSLNIMFTIRWCPNIGGAVSICRLKIVICSLQHCVKKVSVHTLGCRCLHRPNVRWCVQNGLCSVHGVRTGVVWRLVT